MSLVRTGQTAWFWGYPWGQNGCIDQMDTSSFCNSNVCIKANSLPGFGLPPSQAPMLFQPICFADMITVFSPSLVALNHLASPHGSLGIVIYFPASLCPAFSII